MYYLMTFIAGAFLCNSIPHLVAGLRGVRFPTPFSRPSTVGNSSPLANFYWGALNFILGMIILYYNPVELGANGGFMAMLLGGLAVGTYLSMHFDKVRTIER